jgi:hypothetical protein
MTDLDDVITSGEAAELLGRTPGAVVKACQRGTLRARRLGSGTRGIWITTRESVAIYRADYAERRRRAGLPV